jgi:hypothetical protein
VQYGIINVVMSRKGHYIGGHTTLRRSDTSWFTKGSIRTPPDDSGPRPSLSSAEQAEYDAMKRAREPKSRLIKADEKTHRSVVTPSKKVKKKRKFPGIIK